MYEVCTPLKGIERYKSLTDALAKIKRMPLQDHEELFLDKLSKRGEPTLLYHRRGKILRKVVER